MGCYKIMAKDGQGPVLYTNPETTFIYQFAIGTICEQVESNQALYADVPPTKPPGHGFLKDDGQKWARANLIY